MRGIRGFVAAGWLAGTACAPAPEGAVANTSEDRSVTRPDTGEGIANLPYARGRVFHSLDDYLAYLEETQGPIDLPWWREIRPGVYERVVRMPGAQRETATREELMRRFGFTR